MDRWLSTIFFFRMMCAWFLFTFNTFFFSCMWSLLIFSNMRTNVYLYNKFNFNLRQQVSLMKVDQYQKPTFIDIYRHINYWNVLLLALYGHILTLSLSTDLTKTTMTNKLSKVKLFIDVIAHIDNHMQHLFTILSGHFLYEYKTFKQTFDWHISHLNDNIFYVIKRMVNNIETFCRCDKFVPRKTQNNFQLFQNSSILRWK